MPTRWPEPTTVFRRYSSPPHPSINELVQNMGWVGSFTRSRCAGVHGGLAPLRPPHDAPRRANSCVVGIDHHAGCHARIPTAGVRARALHPRSPRGRPSHPGTEPDLDFSRVAVDGSHIRALKGPQGGTKSRRPGRDGQQGPPDHRRHRHPARRHPDRRQSQRRHPAHRVTRSRSAGAGQARPATAPPRRICRWRLHTSRGVPAQTAVAFTVRRVGAGASACRARHRQAPGGAGWRRRPRRTAPSAGPRCSVRAMLVPGVVRGRGGPALVLRPPVEPMLVQAADVIPALSRTAPGPAYEQKFDGHRALVFTPAGRAGGCRRRVAAGCWHRRVSRTLWPRPSSFPAAGSSMASCGTPRRAGCPSRGCSAGSPPLPRGPRPGRDVARLLRGVPQASPPRRCSFALALGGWSRLRRRRSGRAAGRTGACGTVAVRRRARSHPLPG